MKRKFNFTKKDLLLVVILSVTILLCNYALSWHAVYKEHNMSVSVLSDLLTEVTSSEFKNYIIENPNSIVYFAASNDNEAESFEQGFKRIINSYYLNDSLIYVNTKDLELTVFLATYDVNEKNIDKTPVLVYFEDGIISDYINYSNNKMDNKSIVKFFKLYGDL